ncbi:MAG: hypothetical protein KDI09_05555, partial [Halioglobus sp.]|nr:hypothetical protein [Halioglobus sp.]
MAFRRAFALSLLTLLASQLVCADEALPPTVIKDPYYGEVLFDFYQEDYFPAIVKLLAAQKESRLPNHDAEAELLLGGLYLSYGQHRRAADIFQRLLASGADASVRDRTWFFLARIWHQRGYNDEAQSALNKVQGDLPGAMEAERRMLLAQVLIDKGEHRQAIDLLDRWRDRTEW